MDTPFPFEPLLVFGFLSIMLLLGVFLRVKIGIFQKYLFPSCLIGGVLGLLLINTGLVPLEVSNLETFAYHFFNLSFISVGLTRDNDAQGKQASGKEMLKGPSWMALVQGVTFPIQAALGGLLIILLGFLGFKLFPTFGFLAPLGFNEGPGQALSFGKVWEGLGFEHGATIGLAFAAIGFFFSFFVGVPLANWGIRKGYSVYAPKSLPQDVLTGIVPKTQKGVSAGELTMHSGNIETLAFQMALIGFIYVITYLFVKVLGMAFSPDVAKMLWGFFFFFGLGAAILLSLLLKKIGLNHLVNPGVQRRITGWAVDFLIVATVASIQTLVIWKYLLPILIIALSNGLVTTLVVIYLGKRVWSFNLERMVAIYGTVTGTVSSGLLLLRIVDPDFKTPVAVEIGVMNIFVLPIIGICTILVNAPLWWNWGLGMTVLVYVGIMSISLVLLKLLGLWGKSRL